MEPRKRSVSAVIPDRQCFDVLLVGAGPANLVAALELVDRMPAARVLLVERGGLGSDRMCGSRICRDCDHCKVIAGLGGAGLASDGKLHRASDPITVRVFHHLERFGVPRYDPDSRVASFARSFSDRAREAGLTYLPYLSQHVGTTVVREVADRIVARLQNAGVTVACGLDVVSLKPGKDLLEATCRTGGDGDVQLRSKYVLIGTGKGGQRELLHILPAGTLKFAELSPSLGVRYEVPRDAVLSLTGGLVLDPQLALTCKGKGHISTFCTCTGGDVVPYSRNHKLLLGGQSESGGPGALSNIALLCTLDANENPERDWDRRVEGLGLRLGRPFVQTLGAFRGSTRDEVQPLTSLRSFELANLKQALPVSVASLVDEMIARLGVIDPRLSEPTNVLSAPTMEPRWLPQQGFSPLPFLPGVFLVGDVTGHAGGIVAAAATGLMAVDEVIRTEGSRPN